MWAVGWAYDTPLNADRTLIEHWNGSAWTVVPSPNASVRLNVLSGLAVVNPYDIWAVAALDDAIIYQTLIEHWNGAEFLSSVAAMMQPGDALLLGTDLVKDTGRLVRAYDDSAGVTARFNLNVLAVVNRELGADFDLDAFTHVARWNPDEERIEMWLRSTRAQTVHIAALDLDVDFGDGEEMLTEVSCKFRQSRVDSELDAAGLRRTHWWTDDAGDFGLTLAVK